MHFYSYYQQLTMDVIARIAMGQKGSQQFRSQYLDLVRAVFERPANQPFAVAIKVLPPIFTAAVRKLATLTAKMRGMPFIFLQEQIKDVVNERRKLRSENGGKYEAADFIDLFLDAEAEVDLTPVGYSRNNLKVYYLHLSIRFLLVRFRTRNLKSVHETEMRSRDLICKVMNLLPKSSQFKTSLSLSVLID
uniref:Cytochrome P450 n=1 Tax=Parascaris univalens TaxID=6257 RepID=A0A915ASX9_PARUN